MKGALLGGLAGLLVGSVLTYIAQDWRVGVANSFTQVAMLNAVAADRELAHCRAGQSFWPRKRGLKP